MIEVVDYDPEWPKLFESLCTRYQKALTDVPVVAIKHVGSTSVPGLAAKPVIDVDIVVRNEDVKRAIGAMIHAGFRSRGELGISDRWALEAPVGLPRTNTYVVVEGSLAYRNHIAVRDTLRGNPDLRDEYAAVKRSIAARVSNIDRYVEEKSALLSSILERAGLTAEERRLIEDSNRTP